MGLPTDGMKCVSIWGMGGAPGGSLQDPSLIGSSPIFSTNFAVVALWEGNGLSIRLRRVRFPSTAPIFAESQARGKSHKLYLDGSNPSSATKQCLLLSMDRIPCYERGDGGSIPSGGAK